MHCEGGGGALRELIQVHAVHVSKHVRRCRVRGRVEVLGAGCGLVPGGYSWTLPKVYLWTRKPTYLLLTVRRSNATTSTSHRFDSELNRLAAEMGCKGGEGGRNGPVLGQAVQARLPPYTVPPILRTKPVISQFNTYRRLSRPSSLVYRCKWSSRREIPL